jgi:hypothetical protein
VHDTAVDVLIDGDVDLLFARELVGAERPEQIGRASCRERV